MTTIDLRRAELNILCTQGKTFTLTLTYSATNLTGYAATAKVRATPGAGDTLTASSGSGITITGGTNSTVAITWSATSMAAVAVGNYVWELELSSGGVVDPALAVGGSFRVDAEVVT